MRTRRISVRCALRSLCGLGLATVMVGCNSTQTTAPPTRPAQVRALDLSGHPDPTDRDRIALARFVGAWDFKGWYDPPGAPRRETAGIAAGTVEHQHFLMLDTARIVAQAEDKEFSVGSMLFSAEPGVGLMLTAWSSEEPSVQRLRGKVEAEGSRFVFDEIRTAHGTDRLRMILRFETDDRWVAEFFRKSGSPDVAVASYTFKRTM